MNFDRRFCHIITPFFGAGEAKEFVIRYAGEIDESVCWLRYSGSGLLRTQWSINILRYGKHTAFG